ncbi:MAG: transcription antitermination factor NusB [Opitutales bacterium]
MADSPASPGPVGDADDAPERPPNQRRANRVAAMQFLYMADINPSADADHGLQTSLREFFEHRDHPREYYAFGEELAHEAYRLRDEADTIVGKHASNWRLERIARVDLAILRLAIYELHHRRDIPPIVTINEAIDLAKAFSTPDAKRFVNGILDRLKTTLDRPLRTPAI